MIRAQIEGIALQFETAPGLFSPHALDAGTVAMLERARISAGDKVLDLGCGYGAVGIYAAKITQPDRVFMLDNDPLAVEHALRNAARNDVAGAHVILSEGFGALDETEFTLILCNPPYHADFSVPKHFIEKGFNRLALGGRLWMVTKRDLWYRNKLTAIFGGARVHRAGEYFLFEAEKRSHTYANMR